MQVGHGLEGDVAEGLGFGREDKEIGGGVLRGELRGALREYTDTRIAIGNARGDLGALRAAREEGEALHGRLWSVVERADDRMAGVGPGRHVGEPLESANQLVQN